MLGVAFVGGLGATCGGNRVSARMQASMLFLATVALLVPSTVSDADSVAGATVTGRSAWARPCCSSAPTAWVTVYLIFALTLYLLPPGVR